MEERNACGLCGRPGDDCAARAQRFGVYKRFDLRELVLLNCKMGQVLFALAEFGRALVNRERALRVTTPPREDV